MTLLVAALQTPYITSVTPTFGPVAGGTTLVLRGGLLAANWETPPPLVLLESGEPYIERIECPVSVW